MDLFKVKSLEELKTLGKFRELVTKFKEAIGNDKKINLRSWQALYEAICDYQQAKKSKTLKGKKVENSPYFLSKETEIIFYLMELDGEIRVKKLGLTKSHYNNKKKATKWRNDIAKLIHPDKCTHPMAAEATSKLNSIYKEMVGNEE